MPRGGANNTAREASDTRRRKSKGEKKKKKEREKKVMQRSGKWQKWRRKTDKAKPTGRQS